MRHHFNPDRQAILEQEDIVVCEYCTAEVSAADAEQQLNAGRAAGTPPPPGEDDDAWMAIAARHMPGCRWVETRGHPSQAAS